MKSKILIWAAAAFVVSAGACWGQVVDPLHGCIIGTSCADNGQVTPTTVSALPAFTFTVSPGPKTGDTLIDILVPNNEDLSPSSLSFSISGTSAGATDISNIGPFTSTLKGDWTGGGLGGFLGFALAKGSPKNDITAWLPYTQGANCGPSQNATCDPGATGYEVYQIDLGNNELQNPSNPTAPILTLSGSSLPTASLLAGFLGNGSTFGTSSKFISTANSGGIFEAGAPPLAHMPEPWSIVLLGTVALVTVTLLKKKLHSCA